MCKKLGCTNVKYVEEMYENAIRAKFDKLKKITTSAPTAKCFRLLSPWCQNECTK